MATRKSSSKPALAAVRKSVELTGDVYAIQGLADGAYALIQRFYEAHDDIPETGALLRAMRILNVADERLDALGERVEACVIQASAKANSAATADAKEAALRG